MDLALADTRADKDHDQNTSNLESTFTRSEDIWYPDGSIVLLAEKTAFRVHTSMLAQTAEVFRDMFAMPRPTKDLEKKGSDMLFDGNLALPLQDSAVDLSHFLKAIYVLSYFQPSMKASFSKVSAVLRLATKYIATDLRKRAIDFLVTVYPSTLSKWDQRSTLRKIPPLKSEFSSYLLLAIEADFSLMLPAILYDMSQRPSTEVVPMLRRVAELRWDIMSKYLLGVERLRSAETTHLLAFSDTTITTHGYCSDCVDVLKDRTRAKLRDSSAALTDYIRKCSSDSTVVELVMSLTLCGRCAPKAELSIRTGRESLWNELPKLFALSDWDALHSEEEFFSESRSANEESNQ